MSNFKLVKTAAALALGASVVTSAVATTDASAASKYKIKSGKLVYAKSGKVVKGYVTYKSTVYKNGSKLTGLKGKTYYKAGKKATGTYKGAYYVKGVKKVTTGTYNKAYYVKGVKKVSTGLYAKKYYKDGKLATGTYKGAYYVKGIKKVTTGTYAGSYYVKGVKVVSTGLYQDRLYQAGKLSKGYALYKSILYKDSYHNEGLALFEGKLYDGPVLNKGFEVFEGKLYNGSVLSTGFVKHDEKFYNNGELANGEFDGVEYKDGVVVKYEVTSAKTINASEVEIAYSVDVDAKTALDTSNYEIELNGSKIASAKLVDVKFKGDSKNTVIVRLDDTATFSAGDKIVVQVKDEVRTAKDSNKKIQRFASDVFTFEASAKPELKSVQYDGDKGLYITFDRPVKKTTGLIKVDGKVINTTSLVAVEDTLDDSEVAGNYTYRISNVLSNEQVKEGSHEIVIFDVYETARNNAQVSNTLSLTYTVTKSEAIPEVKSVIADNANKFTIYFSEGVALEDAKSLVIKQGNHEYEISTANTIGNDTDAKAYVTDIGNATNSQYVDHITVVIPEATGNTTFANPLYGKDQTKATLDVTVKAFKDRDKYVGLETTKQVVLSKNATTPTLLQQTAKITRVTPSDNSSKTNGLTVDFNQATEAVAASLTSADVIVKNADGIVLPTAEYTVTLTPASGLAAAKLSVVVTPKYEGSSAYTVTLKQDKVKFKTDTTNVVSYNAEATKNNETTVTAKVADDSNFKYVSQTFADQVADKNVVKLAYGQDMDDSALNPANYTLDGKALPAGTKVEFFQDKKHVQITFPDQSIKYSTHYKLAVSTNVKTAKGQTIVNNLRDLGEATAKVTLTDNVSGEFVSAQYLVDTNTAKSTKQIKVVFNEEVKSLDKDDFKVLIGGSTTSATIEKIELTKADSNAKLGTAAIITLGSEVNVSQSASITIVKGTDSEIKSVDLADNKLKEGSTTTATTATVDKDATDAAADAAALVAAKTALATEIAKVTVTKDGEAVKTIKIGTVTYTVSANASTETTAGKYVTAAQATTLVEAIATAQSAHDAAAATVTTLNDAKTTLTNAISTFETNAVTK
ncbi:hypothetical protein [Kurthia gibsonii]|uniref:hypothetical protein n=1 Tax=Kurthia gibsonii TaxID=33946 RepID=UPI001142782D|nr:hypothetical protein [Kurthia gibsonii]GED20824.1 hypothetical protein KGI01_25650 [Kurthia gibsonii]